MNLPTPRRAAFDVLLRLRTRGVLLDQALNDTASFSRQNGRDRAFARTLILHCLRRAGALDEIVNRFLDRPLPQGAPGITLALHLGAAQILALKTPAHAAVSETVDLVREVNGLAKFANLTNAVLRKVASLPTDTLDTMPPEVDLPPWVAIRWQAAYGPDVLHDLALCLRDEPGLDLSFRPDAGDTLTELSPLALAPPIVPHHLRLSAATDLTSLPGFSAGAFWAQDLAASLPVRLLGDVRGLTVLDACAAPGGKTLQLASLGAKVTALDASAKRVSRLHDNIARVCPTAGVQVEVASLLEGAGRDQFDAVLLDAPCSASGTFRRHPDVLLKSPEVLADLAATQREMLNAATRLVRPGGLLIYAVCSLEPEEGAAVIDSALAKGLPLTRVPVSSDEAFGIAEAITAKGDVRLLPSFLRPYGGLDGFFVARLRRNIT